MDFYKLYSLSLSAAVKVYVNAFVVNFQRLVLFLHSDK